MSVFPLDPESLNADNTAAEAAGQALAKEYQSGKPFHHICVDNFLPLEVVQKVREEALAIGEKRPENSSPQEHLKASYNPDILPLYTRAVFQALNSQAFLRFLEEMTGIPHLIPDPYYKGAGIHRTNNGGYLGVHADFNLHKQMYLERRLNVLVYLNPDWKPEYGGAFEVWTDDMKERVAQFPPIMNRMCCFSTSSNSYHGNPEPVNHPEGDPRLSIALYYYTPTWSEDRVAHSTLFRPRPGSNDKAASQAHRRRIAQNVLPPILYRKFKGPLQRLGF
jgi:Rps23 Pro-64 3,4-dihydroxylase Tpa1-like proline 4-hydroxylase